MELDKPGGNSGFTHTADISRYSDFSLATHSPHHHFPLLLLHARVDDDDGQFVLFSAIKQVLRTNERRTDGRTDAETDVCHTLPIFYSNSV